MRSSSSAFGSASWYSLPRDPLAELGLAQAAVAGTEEAALEAQGEDGAAGGAVDGQLGLDRLWNRQVALAAVDERLELDLDRLSVLLARPQAEPPQVEGGHGFSVAAGGAGKAPPANAKGIIPEGICDRGGRAVGASGQSCEDAPVVRCGCRRRGSAASGVQAWRNGLYAD